MSVPPAVVGLRARQIEILAYVAAGLTAREIGVKLDISEHTVKCHMRKILKALDAPNAAAAVGEGYRRGLLRVGSVVRDEDHTRVPTVVYDDLLRVARLLIEGQPRVARTLARQLLTPGGLLLPIARITRRRTASQSTN